MGNVGRPKKGELTMRMLLTARLPNKAFNAAVKDGSVASKVKAILDETKPQAVYFTEMNGLRGVVMLVELESPSRVPALAEPWFLSFDAEVEFHVVMGPEELQQAGLDKLGKKWA
jgi:hypothetical protein